MTTATVNAPANASQRILNVVRLHLANPWTTITFPWMILGVILAGNLVIWWLIFTNAQPEDRVDISSRLQYSGASLFIFVYMMVVAVQAMSITFQFALGYSVTRRDFYLGSALTFVLLSAMYAIGLSALAWIEEATGGWGMGGRMFTPVYFGSDWLQRLFVFFVLFLFFFFVGSAVAGVWVRWKSNGLVAFFVALGAVLIGGGALLTVTTSWNTIGNFLAGAGLIGSYAWSLVITAIAGITGFFILRKATPRS
jgi:hypothetical protein